MLDVVIGCIITALVTALFMCIGYWLMALKDYVTEVDVDKKIDAAKVEVAAAREASFRLLKLEIDSNGQFWESEHKHYKETVEDFADALKANTVVVSELKGELISLRGLINQIVMERK